MSLAGGAALIVSPFLPWLRIGDVALAGIPDPAGFFVLALGIVAVVMSLASIATRRKAPYALLLVGVAACTTLMVVWRTGPATVARRALARAEAVSLVDNVPMVRVPPVGVAAGLYVGIAGSLAVAAAILAGRGRDKQDR
jgi:hypothetical protein